jgi:hypothetical protein
MAGVQVIWHHGHALEVVGEDPQSDPGAGAAQPPQPGAAQPE